MAITYTPTTNFGAKDSLPTNDPDKVIKGSEFTTEFTALQTAFSLAAPNASPTFTGTVTIPTADINGGAIDGTTIGGTTPAAATFTSLTATTADINGGAIDGTVIGAATPAAASFTTVSATGNITVGGTVDGRDVAADGTKLDGIEAGADVTDTTNVTAAGALMDSELTNIAAVKALNQGVATTDSPSFAGLTATGSVSLAGASTTADITFGDNDKAIFGAGSDLEIYHSGTHSIINETGTGELKIQATNLRLQSASGGENYLTADLNGAVRVYYDDTQRLQTTATGIAVTGDATFADNGKAIFGAGSDLQIYHDGSNSYIQDEGTGGLIISSNGAAVYIQKGLTETSAEFNTDGAVKLRYDNVTKFETTATGIDVTGTVTADGLTVSGSGAVGSFDRTDANAIIELKRSGSLQGYIGASTGGDVILYNASAAQKFRAADNGDISFYEDTGTTPKFFWDASAEALGIGTTSPDGIFEATGGRSYVRGSNENFTFGVGRGGQTSNYFLGATASASPDLLFSNNSGTTNVVFTHGGNVGIGTGSPTDKLHVSGTASVFKQQNNVTNWTLGLDAADQSYKIKHNGSERMRIDSSGRLLVGLTGASGFGTVETDTFTTTGQCILARTGGNVGIGTTSPGAKLAVVGTTKIGEGVASNTSKLMVNTTSGTAAGIQLFQDSVESWIIQNPASSTALTFANSGTERMRLDASGNLLVGTTGIPNGTSIYGAALSPSTNGRTLFYQASSATTGNTLQAFYNPNGQVGSISTSGSATSFNTSSDARLKENIADAEDAGAKVDAIQVRQFDWKADGSHQDYGMVAQELMTVAPEAVSGDPESDDMMGVDYSKLVPMLVKEIQSLRARVAQLEGA